jgi:histidine triad (HIT) family protein
MNCLFCDFTNDEKGTLKVWEDDLFLAFLDINPINPGHTLLIPKKHHSDVFAMDEQTYKSIFENAKFLAVKIKEALNAPRVGLAIEGFGVDHAHIHLVPVYSGNDLNPERAKPVSKNELEVIQKILISSLEEK